MSRPNYYNGKTIKEWSEICDISAQMIRNRLKEGWTIEEATSIPPHERRNRNASLVQLAKRNNVAISTLRYRIKRGMLQEDAVIFSPKKNLVGLRSGRLVVKQEIEPKKDPNGRSRRQVLCLCDCGNETTALAETIVSQTKRSCGCLRKEVSSKKKERILIGQTFGRWTIESEAFRDKFGIHWNAVCTCGNKGTPTTSNLLSGSSISCGCYNKEQVSLRERKDITGQKFFMLTAIEFVGINDNKSCLWRCICDCGREIITTTGKLLGGQVLSCGCIKSKYEKIIGDILLSKDIYFIKEKYFRDLKYINYLYFDFCILDHDNNIHLIEYQGEQHFKDSGYFGKQQREVTDQMKKEYCDKNNIPLYEIRYYENVEERLNEIIAHVNPVLSSEMSEKV